MDPSAMSSGRPPSEAVRVLVVDDDDQLREPLAAMLLQQGYLVDSAARAADAVRIARRTNPHVIVLDLGLPEIDGWEALRLLRSGEPARPPYIIVMSGFTDARSRQRAFEAGCDQYIVKEVGAEAILAAVRTYLLRLH